MNHSLGMTFYLSMYRIVKLICEQSKIMFFLSRSSIPFFFLSETQKKTAVIGYSQNMVSISFFSHLFMSKPNYLMISISVAPPIPVLRRSPPANSVVYTAVLSRLPPVVTLHLAAHSNI